MLWLLISFTYLSFVDSKYPRYNCDYLFEVNMFAKVLPPCFYFVFCQLTENVVDKIAITKYALVALEKDFITAIEL